MIDAIFWVWVLIWFGLMFLHVYSKSRILGIFASLWLLLTGVFLLPNGFEYKTGYTENMITNTTTQVIYEYSKYNNSNIIAIFFITMAIYLLFRNAYDLVARKE